MATKHQKTELVAPVLNSCLGLTVVAAEVDTDTLGTFSGEGPRLGSPLETVVAKARIGMDATGMSIGIASEGTIGPSFAMPFLVVARELVVLVDDDRCVVICGTEVGYGIVTVSSDVGPDEPLDALLARGQFPAHGLVVRPASGPLDPVFKGIHDVVELRRAIALGCAASPDGRARVESDLRAHHCPSRRPIIARAGRLLAERAATRCPSCDCPGWGVVRREIGVPCGWCGGDAEIPRAEVFGCVDCSAEQTVEVAATADPGQCRWCNP